MKKLSTCSYFIFVLAACGAPAQSSSEFDINDWDSVLAAAKGQTVNWYIWGGSDSINAYVDNFYGTALKERYDITLNRVPLADTRRITSIRC
jgi:putative spermidine/putrescine transport system substrate-binding protein